MGMEKWQRILVITKGKMSLSQVAVKGSRLKDPQGGTRENEHEAL